MITWGSTRKSQWYCPIRKQWCRVLCIRTVAARFKLHTCVARVNVLHTSWIQHSHTYTYEGAKTVGTPTVSERKGCAGILQPLFFLPASYKCVPLARHTASSSAYSSRQISCLAYVQSLHPSCAGPAFERTARMIGVFQKHQTHAVGDTPTEQCYLKHPDNYRTSPNEDTATPESSAIVVQHVLRRRRHRHRARGQGDSNTRYQTTINQNTRLTNIILSRSRDWHTIVYIHQHTNKLAQMLFFFFFFFSYNRNSIHT